MGRSTDSWISLLGPYNASTRYEQSPSIWPWSGIWCYWYLLYQLISIKPQLVSIYYVSFGNVAYLIGQNNVGIKFSLPTIIFVTFVQKNVNFSLKKLFMLDYLFRLTKLFVGHNFRHLQNNNSHHFCPTLFCPINNIYLPTL